MSMFTTLLLLSAVFALGDASRRRDCDRKACPPGWPSDSTHCYHYVPIMTTWPEAERKCLLLGGNLASVHSLPSIFPSDCHQRKYQKLKRTWIGATMPIKVRSTVC
nr:galactose-specific lectin nattectin-like [Salvelinus alpinus]